MPLSLSWFGSSRENNRYFPQERDMPNSNAAFTAKLRSKSFFRDNAPVKNIFVTNEAAVFKCCESQYSYI